MAVKFPVEILEPRRRTDDVQNWTFVYHTAGKLPPPVERKALNLLDGLLRTLLFQRFGVMSLREVSRTQAQIIVDEMQAAGVRDIHEAICWCYATLMPEMMQG